MTGAVTFANSRATSTSSGAEDAKDTTAAESASDGADSFHVQSSAGSKPQGRSESEPTSVNDSIEWQPFPFEEVPNLWSSSSADIYLDPALQEEEFSSQWPIRPYDEAKLLRFFVTEVATWFDSPEDTKHFACSLPELAHAYPVLRYAIFALSAKLLGQQGKLNESISLRYQDECYKALLPELQQQAFEPPHLAAVFLLRLILHMTDVEDADTQSMRNSFIGLDVFLDAWRQNLESSIHASLVMNFVRLYIQIAWNSQRALDLLESNCLWLCHHSPTTPHPRGWVRKAVLQCARCVNFAYDDSPKTPERWLSINANSEGWETNLPAICSPVFKEDTWLGNPFPKVLFADDMFAIAYLYHYHSRLLMLNNIPKSDGYPDLPNTTQEKIDEESRLLLREICGAASCHSNCTTALLIASLGISYKGHLLKTQTEQEAAYKLLVKASLHFPCIQTRETFGRMQKAWGFDGQMNRVSCS